MFSGKVVDVMRRTTEGFLRGKIEVGRARRLSPAGPATSTSRTSTSSPGSTAP